MWEGRKFPTGNRKVKHEYSGSMWKWMNNENFISNRYKIIYAVGEKKENLDKEKCVLRYW